MPATEGLPDQEQQLPPVTLEHVNKAWADVLDGKMSPSATPEQQMEHLDHIAQTSARMAEERRVQEAVDSIELRPPQE